MTAPLRVVSLFSGAGGFDLGLERAGMVTVAQCEWDARCQAVLARHWPDVPRWGDVSDVRGADLPDCDLVAFGSPCQDLSVAGKRAGMVEGETRSGLFYEAVRIIQEMLDDGSRTTDARPRWVLWENVCGALTSNGGADFGAVLDALGELGAVDVQWRVLDAQWFGVPQRRRRVFVVARLDPRAAGRDEVLPLGARVRRDSAARGEAGEGAAGAAEGGAPGGGLPTVAGDGELVGSLTQSLGAGGPDDGQAQAGWLVPQVLTYSFDSTWSGAFGVCENQAPPMKLGNGTVPAVTVPVEAEGVDLYNQTTTGSVSVTLRTDGEGKGGAVIAPPDLAVRRLTPRECERLMGWPDDWTRWAADGSEVADSSRYRMCGNGVASPVAEWIGRCIVAAEQEVDG